MTFQEKLKSAVTGHLGLCVGLDPVVEQMPDRFKNEPAPLASFCKDIIYATRDWASAYKPNLAFFEAYGADGWRQLDDTIRAIPPDKIILADAKRGDIGNTAKCYATAIFSKLNADAVTINPYLGSDAMEPFLTNADKGAFVLAITSNPGGKDIQELVCDGIPIYRHVVRLARGLNRNHNVGLVMGATRPELWGELLGEAIDLPLLVPGIGAQGGDLGALKAAVRDYPAPVLVNASRSISYASRGADFTVKARDAARAMFERLSG